jgi:hypothetical protein
LVSTFGDAFWERANVLLGSPAVVQSLLKEGAKLAVQNEQKHMLEVRARGKKEGG